MIATTKIRAGHYLVSDDLQPVGTVIKNGGDWEWTSTFDADHRPRKGTKKTLRSARSAMCSSWTSDYIETPLTATMATWISAEGLTADCATNVGRQTVADSIVTKFDVPKWMARQAIRQAQRDADQS